MRHRYSLRDYLHFAGMLRRNRRRQKTWAKHYENALRNKSYRLPHPAVFQLIPTEACNLNCPMCNQWGEKGYFPRGVRQAEHMDIDGLTGLLKSISPQHSLLSLHGGEPFVYKHIDWLLELLQENRFDVFISTNGTLFDRSMESLTRLENLALLFSIDGDRETHDNVRGQGRFDQAKEGLEALFDARRRAGMPLPMVIMSITVCEWTTGILEKAFDVARELGVMAINYNMRWFLSEEAGLAYEKHLQTHFNVKSRGAWRGFISEPNDHDYKTAAAALKTILAKKRFRIAPPFVVTMPRLKRKDFETYFSDYLEVFGNESCFLPFYLARVHSNGDMIYCPGHPDIIVGNVFKDGFEEALNSEMSIRFRKHILHHRFPICNRCCGLYMTNYGRPYEQKIRRKLGIGKNVTVHYP